MQRWSGGYSACRGAHAAGTASFRQRRGLHHMTWLHAPRGTWAGRARPPLGRRPACMPLGCAPGAPALLSPLCGVARVRQRGAERRRGFRRRAPRRRCMSRTAAPGSTTPATRTPSSPWCTATPTSASGSRVRLSPAQEGCARPPQYWSSVFRCPHLHGEVAATPFTCHLHACATTTRKLARRAPTCVDSEASLSGMRARHAAAGPSA